MLRITLYIKESDKPIAGLIQDLKARGLLDDTLISGMKFGRMPIYRGIGRDHNPGTQTALMIGAGIQGGQEIGASDEGVLYRQLSATTCMQQSFIF